MCGIALSQNSTHSNASKNVHSRPVSKLLPACGKSRGDGDDLATSDDEPARADAEHVGATGLILELPLSPRLGDIADWVLEGCSENDRKALEFTQGKVITIISFCTGFGTDIMVADALSDSWERKGWGKLAFRHLAIETKEGGPEDLVW
jgi:hypothetical protein